MSLKGKEKIILISNYWRQSDGGGVLVYLQNLLQHLSKTLEVKIIARKGVTDNDREFVVPGNRLGFMYRCFMFCLKEKPTIIHSQSDWYCLLPALLCKLFFKVKIVHSLHSIPAKKYSGLTRFLFYQALNRCDHIHFVSKFLRTYYAEAQGMAFSRTSVVYPGSNHIKESHSEQEKSIFRERYHIRPEARIILAQGLTAHHLKRDGAIILLDVFAKLRARFPEYVLLMTKNGKYLSSLQTRALELGITDHVVFTGNLEDPSIANAVADIYAHITLGEGGVSIAILEAMAMGNPVIATAVGGIPELMTGSTKTAVMVNPTFGNVYAALKLLCADHSLCHSLGANAQRYVKSNFSWEATAEQFRTLFYSMSR